MKVQVAIDKLFSHKLFSNKYFLYAVIAASLLTNYMHIVASHYEIVGFFILIGIIMMNFSKNVAVVLTVCLLLTQIIMAGRSLREGLETMPNVDLNISQQIKLKNEEIAKMQDELSQKTTQLKSNNAKMPDLITALNNAQTEFDKAKNALKTASNDNKVKLKNILDRKKLNLDQATVAQKLVEKQIDGDKLRTDKLPGLIATAQAEVDKLKQQRLAKQSAAASAKAAAAAEKTTTAATTTPAATTTTPPPAATTTTTPVSTTGADVNESLPSMIIRLKDRNNKIVSMFRKEYPQPQYASLNNYDLMKKVRTIIPPKMPNRLQEYFENTRKINTANKAGNAKNSPNINVVGAKSVSSADRKDRTAEINAARRAVKAKLRGIGGRNRSNFALLNEEDSDTEDDNEFDFMGPSDMSGLTQGTTNLMTKQKDLFSFMNSMTPLIENAKKMLSGLDLTKLQAK